MTERIKALERRRCLKCLELCSEHVACWPCFKAVTSDAEERVGQLEQLVRCQERDWSDAVDRHWKGLDPTQESALRAELSTLRARCEAQAAIITAAMTWATKKRRWEAREFGSRTADTYEHHVGKEEDDMEAAVLAAEKSIQAAVDVCFPPTALELGKGEA
jgi:hypothetical protein